MNDSTRGPRLELRLETEVPGTPEQVWSAIATGPGISAWFVPTTLEERENGQVTMDFGEGLGTDSGRVAVWDPPKRVVFEGWSSDPSGSAAYAYVVEAREGGSCVVRFVQTGFDESPESQAMWDSMESGWRLFFHNLRLYLEHFRGQPCASILVNASSPATRAEAWQQLAAELGLAPNLTVGAEVAAPPGDPTRNAADGEPAVHGRVDRYTETMLTLVVDQPAPGTVFFCTEGQDEPPSTVSAYLYFFGNDAAEVAERERPRWTAWIQDRFPAAAAS